MGFLGSQLNSKGSEDASKQRSEEKSRNGVAKKICSEEEVFADPKLLKHMDNDALISYFNKSMNVMKRQMIQMRKDLFINYSESPSSTKNHSTEHESNQESLS